MNNHIQISDVTPWIQYAADGSQTQFSYPFPIFVEDDLEVYTGDTKEISGYSVLGAGNSYGGSITFDTPPASGVVVTLRRSLAIERITDFQQSGAFRAKDINDELDYLTAALQQVADDVGRAVRLSSTDEAADLELPSKDERANKVLGFDASGDVIATSGSGGTGGGVTDHGQLTGLADDDHGQYHTNARGDARYYTRTALDTGQLDGRYYTETEVDSQFAALGSAAALNAGTAVDDVVQLEDVGGGTPGLPAVDGSQLTGLPSGVADHGALTGLSDDDHNQYHTNARGDARYYTRTALDSGQLDGRYYTETEVDAQFAALGSVAALDVGTAVDDLVQLEDVGGGTPGLPAVDGSQLTGLPGGGDMLAATYDPQSIAGDAFDTDNHTDGSTNGVYTLAERAKLAALGTVETGTGTNSADVLPNETAVVVTTVTGAPGVTAGTYRPQPAETDDVTAEPGACWISGTDEVSVRVENTGSSTISASALTVTSYVVSK